MGVVAYFSTASGLGLPFFPPRSAEVSIPVIQRQMLKYLARSSPVASRTASCGTFTNPLSIASITYGALLGAYLLAGRWPRANGRDVVVATLVTMAVMLVVVFSRPLAQSGLTWLEPVASLAWPWYVPLGTALAFGAGVVSSLTRGGAHA